jgi:hypothetical protein
MRADGQQSPRPAPTSQAARARQAIPPEGPGPLPSPASRVYPANRPELRCQTHQETAMKPENHTRTPASGFVVAADQGQPGRVNPRSHFRVLRPGPGSLVFMPRAIPHGFTVSDTGPSRIIIVTSPGGFDQFVAAAGEPAPGPAPAQPAPPASPGSQPPTASRSCPRPNPDNPSQASARLPAPGVTRSTTGSARLKSKPPRRL